MKDTVPLGMLGRPSGSAGQEERDVTLRGGSVNSGCTQRAAWTCRLLPGARSGCLSRDKKWIYRAIILDFFWAKDALQAKALTGLVNSWNFFHRGDGHGPMSITTTSDEYRTRFLSMVDEIVEVTDSAGRPAGEIRSPPSEGTEEV